MLLCGSADLRDAVHQCLGEHTSSLYRTNQRLFLFFKVILLLFYLYVIYHFLNVSLFSVGGVSETVRSKGRCQEVRTPLVPLREHMLYACVR